MKKEVIVVSKDKNPIEILEEMRECAQKAWFFLHINVRKKLLDYQIVTWEYANLGDIWGWTAQIIGKNGCIFQCKCEDPESIFFLKMEE